VSLLVPILALLLLAPPSAGTAAGTAEAPEGGAVAGAPADTSRFVRLGGLYRLDPGKPFSTGERPWLRTGGVSAFVVPLEYPAPTRLLLRPRRVELNRFQAAMYGLDRGAAMAFNAGAAGSMLGFWDEDTALRMTGLGAVLGAMWGGIFGADDPEFRARTVWPRIRIGPGR
jgi:hypothetical protein